jgi:hypothetical protein
MPDKEKVIKGLDICINTIRTSCPRGCPYYEQCTGIDNVFKPILRDALALLKEQNKIEEQLIEAFNTIRNAYNAPANREKLLLNYLLRIERTVKWDG